MDERDQAIETSPGDDTLARLQRVLEALATTGERQKALFPDLAGPGERLALEFDDCYHALLRDRSHENLPPEALTVLSEIDRVFDGMVNAHEHVWSAQGVAEREEWKTMRHLSAQALQILGWPPDEPARG